GLQTAQQDLPTGAVDPTHAPDVTCQVPFRNKRRQRLLHEWRAVGVRPPFGSTETPTRPGRRDGKPQPQPRKQALGKRTYIENRLGAIQGLQRIQGPLAKTELGIVI